MHILYKVASLLLGACLSLVLSLGANAQSETKSSWTPDRPITIIVPSNPGGGWDQTARFVQQTIIQNEMLPVSIEVINRGGGGGTIALAELVETYTGDPHKLMVTGFGMVGSSLMHESDYSLKDITPLARLTGDYQVIAVSKDAPHQSLESLMEAFKADPKSISWAGGSAGGSDQIFIVQVAEALGIPTDSVNYVAFTGGGEANAALMGNQVSAAITGFSEIKSLVEGGRVKVLAVSSDERVVDPYLPTFVEKGIDVTFQNWRGFVAAPGISEQQKAYYTDIMAQVRASDYWQEVLARNDWQDSFLIEAPLKTFFTDNKNKTAKTLASMGLGKSSEISAIGPYFFPNIIGLGLLLTGLALIVQSWRGAAATTGQSALASEEADDRSWKTFLLTILLVCLYIILLKLVGFVFATPAFIVVFAYIIGSKSIVRDIIISLILTGLAFLIFEKLLNVSLP